MLAGSSGVTVKKYEEPNIEGGSSTIINVNQIRLNASQSQMSSRGLKKSSAPQFQERSHKQKQKDEEELKNNDEDVGMLSEDQYKDENHKVLKAGSQMKNLLFPGGKWSEKIDQERQMKIKRPHFVDKEDQITFKGSLFNSFTIDNAHSDQINCLQHLKNGIFASCS